MGGSLLSTVHDPVTALRQGLQGAVLGVSAGVQVDVDSLTARCLFYALGPVLLGVIDGGIGAQLYHFRPLFVRGS